MKKIFNYFSIVLSISIILTSCGKQPVKNESETYEITNPDYIVGAWINYNEIKELVCLANNESEFISVVDNTLKKLSKYNVNTIFLHMRAFDDCFYRSDVFPVSEYAADKNGELEFDVLKVFTDIALKYSIAIHAWINPYRIRKDGQTEKINPGTPAYEIFMSGNKNQELIICDNAIFYNPASVNSQKRILDCVKEILENYNVAGIHFDDYFYPAASADIDNIIFDSYIKNGGNLSLQDYRRQCVNSMISSVYSIVKSYNKNLIFSVSPAADISYNFSSAFADVELWAKNKGYVDWIIPQIYFGFLNEKKPFQKVAENWEKLTEGSSVKLIIGLPLYKAGKEDSFAGSGRDEWVNNSDIISRQVKYIKENTNMNGYVYYSASYLYDGKSLEENNNLSLFN